jgi:hypothetical protein
MGKSRGIRFNQQFLIRLVLGFLLFYLLFLFGKSLKNSLFFSQKDRINVVFYGKESAFLSFGLTDKVHYLAYFSNNILAYVPGGYGRYKIGSLGKLTTLEKKPSIMQKTFSSIISSYVDFYFFPQKSEIYSDIDSNKKKSYVPKLSLSGLLGINYKTNANFFDRLFLFILLINKRRGDFSLLNTEFHVDEKNKFYEEDFFTEYQGYFYQESLRSERKNLQIYYYNYNSMQILSRIIEGEGIRIVDLTPFQPVEKNCRITEKSENISQSANFLAKIFNCKIEKGDTGVGDIRIILGEALEKEWE